MTLKRQMLSLSLAVAVWPALALGAAHAQTSGAAPAAAPAASGPAYYVAEFEVADREAIKPYSSRVAATFEPFGGRFIVRGADPVPLEGEKPIGRVVVIAFDSMEQALAWYRSPAYQEIIPIRHGAGRSNTYILPGLPR